RGITLAPLHICFWFKPSSSNGRWVTTQTTQRDTWCISRASKPPSNTTHIPSALRGKRCATHEGIQKGEQWCKKCIWGNVLPEWKSAFESVDNIQSGEFIALWTARINHFADRYSVAPADAIVSAIPKDSARERTAVASTNARFLRSHASHLRARVSLAGLS